MHDKWDTLKENCVKCQECALCATRTNVVFGVGNQEAEVMFIGEGPGEQEDLKGQPFVGRSGQLLDKFLYAIDLDRTKNIFIANIVKCRPPQNRDPLPDEQATCFQWLDNQIKLMQPKIIVCLGRVAAMKMMDEKIKVTVQHGQFINKDGILYMATFHPAALLRNPNNKPAALEDFFALRDKIREICTKTY